MITIRHFADADLEFGQRLSGEAGWNQTAEDWRRCWRMQPDGCFVGLLDGEPVGTATTCTFGDVAWLGMVLVDARRRRRGVGRALVKHALSSLDAGGVESVRLDATSFGAPLYREFGFDRQFRVTRFAGVPGRKAGATLAAAGAVLSAAEPAALVELDRSVVGYDRGRLLAELTRAPGNCFFAILEKGDLRGYLCARPGRLATLIGPAVACSFPVGARLLAAALRSLPGRQVFVDVPQENRQAVKVLRAFGLQPAREFIRMCRGAPIRERLADLWASSGPEKG